MSVLEIKYVRVPKFHKNRGNWKAQLWSAVLSAGHRKFLMANNEHEENSTGFRRNPPDLKKNGGEKKPRGADEEIGPTFFSY